MKKKQVSHAIIISVMLSFVIAVFHTIHASELTPLAQMAEGMERQDVSIDKWTLHAKQNMSLTEKEFYKKVQRLKSEYRQYDWAIAREDKIIKAIGTYTDKKIVLLLDCSLSQPSKNTTQLRIYYMSK